MKSAENSFKKIIILIYILILLTVLFMITGCEKKPSSSSTPISKSGLYFDTLITVSIYDSDNTDILDECFDICSKYEKMLSATLPESDIYKINHSGGNEVEVSPETIKIIQDSIDYSKATSGLYDITIYPVAGLWDFHEHDNTPPRDSAIRKQLPHVNYNNIVIGQNNNISLSDPYSSMDLGSIAKGYIADRLSDYLKGRGIHSAIINIGGDMNIIGSKENNSPFVIGIKNPDNPDEVMSAINARSICIATSGTYERYIDYQGQKYHHILSPHTGYPVDTDISSVTIITDSSEKADALCTCAILLGSENSLKIVEETQNTEAYMKLTNGKIIKSSGVEKYLK